MMSHYFISYINLSHNYQIAVCKDITKWKQSWTDCRRIFLSSISILNSLSRASWTKMQVLISTLSFSLFQFVLNVIGTPSHLWGSICLNLSPTHLMILFAITWGYWNIISITVKITSWLAWWWFASG